jgi:hypothetical protein
VPELYFPKQTGPTKRQKRATEHALAKAFREMVWTRDGGRDRATGELVVLGSPLSFLRGEVHHLKGRNVMPEWKYEPMRAVLLSASNHELADARGGYRLKATDPETGDPAVDASKPMRWTLYDTAGQVQWTRVR